MNRIFILGFVPGLALAILFHAQAAPAPVNNDAFRIARLIEQLGGAEFADREKATQELETIGLPAYESLKIAVKSDDPEIRRRAEDLIAKMHKSAASAKALAAKTVRLTCKDASIADAVAMLREKSGYSVALVDPQTQLKEKTITLDTGDVDYWKAFDQLCAAAELVEVFPKGRAEGAIALAAGKRDNLPTAYAGALRIRVLPKATAGALGRIEKNQWLVPLQLSLEPSLNWVGMPSIHIDKALDDRGQTLSANTNVVNNQTVPIPPDDPLGGRAVLPQQAVPTTGMHQIQTVRLTNGERGAKSLKELAGVVSATIKSAPRIYLTADDITTAAGKTFKGEDGGFIKVLDTKAGPNDTWTVRLEFEPPADAVPIMNQQVPINQPVGRLIGPWGLPVPVPLPAPIPRGIRIQPIQPEQKAVPLPKGALQVAEAQPLPVPIQAPIQIQIQVNGPIQIGVGPGFAIPSMPSHNGLTMLDEKGKRMPFIGTAISVIQGPGGLQQSIALTYKVAKGQPAPAKLVYVGVKNTKIEVPFKLNNLPLE